MNKEDIKNFIESKKTSRIMTAVVILAGVIFVFHMGEEFGYRKAEIMDHMSGGYNKAFGPRDSRRNGPMGYLFDDQTGTHGVAGKIISVTAEKILVEGNEGIEKTIIIDKDTLIKKQRETVLPETLKANDFIVVIGSPDTNGQIKAKIIRIVPPPPTGLTPATQTTTSTITK